MHRPHPHAKGLSSSRALGNHLWHKFFVVNVRQKSCDYWLWNVILVEFQEPSYKLIIIQKMPLGNLPVISHHSTIRIPATHWSQIEEDAHSLHSHANQSWWPSEALQLADIPFA